MKSKPKSFEYQWEEAFRHASEEPPPAVWQQIEKELEHNPQRKPFWFWWASPKLYAGLAAALVIGLGFLINALMPSKLKQGSGGKYELSSKSKTGVNSTKHLPSSGEVLAQVSSVMVVKEPLKSAYSTKTLKELVLLTNGSFGGNVEVVNMDIPQAINTFNQLPLAEQPPLADVSFVPQRQWKNIESLTIKGFRTFKNRFVLKREKLVFDEKIEEAEVVSKSKQKMWLGFQSGIAPFKPNFSEGDFRNDVVGAVAADLQSDYMNKTTEAGIENRPTLSAVLGSMEIPKNSIEASRALNLGVQVGRKISRRIGVESGVRFMNARAILSSNVYSVDASGRVDSFFAANYLTNRANGNQTVISVNQTNKQGYNYLNLPLQVSYQLPIYANLGIEFLGGFSGDFLVGSTVKTAQLQRLKSSNSNFNLLNLSGLGGIRLSYGFTSRWEANLGTNYQKAIFSGLSSESDISFRPSLLGVQYGLRYKMR
jgi:hypothetical protein